MLHKLLSVEAPALLFSLLQFLHTHCLLNLVTHLTHPIELQESQARSSFTELLQLGQFIINNHTSCALSLCNLWQNCLLSSEALA